MNRWLLPRTLRKAVPSAAAGLVPAFQLFARCFFSFLSHVLFASPVKVKTYADKDARASALAYLGPVDARIVFTKASTRERLASSGMQWTLQSTLAPLRLWTKERRRLRMSFVSGMLTLRTRTTNVT